MSHLRLKVLCHAGSVAFAFAAAICWVCASKAKATDKNDKRYDRGIEFRYRDKKGNLIQVLASAMKQSRLNLIAAFLAVLAAVLEAVALAIPSD